MVKHLWHVTGYCFDRSNGQMETACRWTRVATRHAHVEDAVAIALSEVWPKDDVGGSPPVLVMRRIVEIKHEGIVVLPGENEC